MLQKIGTNSYKTSSIKKTFMFHLLVHALKMVLSYSTAQLDHLMRDEIPAKKVLFQKTVKRLSHPSHKSIATIVSWEVLTKP